MLIEFVTNTATGEVTLACLPENENECTALKITSNLHYYEKISRFTEKQINDNIIVSFMIENLEKENTEEKRKAIVDMVSLLFYKKHSETEEIIAAVVSNLDVSPEEMEFIHKTIMKLLYYHMHSVLQSFTKYEFTKDCERRAF